MAALTLGAAPISLAVKLIKGADFVFGFDSLDGEWADGAVIALVFNDTADTTWTATIDGTAVDWDVDKADVDALIEALPSPSAVRLTYTEGTIDRVWAQGEVEITTGWV